MCPAMQNITRFEGSAVTYAKVSLQSTGACGSQSGALEPGGMEAQPWRAWIKLSLDALLVMCLVQSMIDFEPDCCSGLLLGHL